MRSTKVSCHLCGQAFSRRYQLQAHLDTHNGIKRFRCDSCKVEFTRKHDLKVHMETKHPRGDPVQIPCRRTKPDGTVEGCHKVFNRKSLLLRHLSSIKGRSCRSDDDNNSSPVAECMSVARQSRPSLGTAAHSAEQLFAEFFVKKAYPTTYLDNNATKDWDIVLWKVVLVIDASIGLLSTSHGAPHDHTQSSRLLALKDYNELADACSHLLLSSDTVVALEGFGADAGVYPLVYLAVAMMARHATCLDKQEDLLVHRKFSQHPLFRNFLHQMPGLLKPNAVYTSLRELRMMVNMKLQFCCVPIERSWEHTYDIDDSHDPTVRTDRWLAALAER